MRRPRLIETIIDRNAFVVSVGPDEDEPGPDPVAILFRIADECDAMLVEGHALQADDPIRARAILDTVQRIRRAMYP